MRAVVQRVQAASVAIEGKTVAQISKGLLIFLGVGQGDGLQQGEKLLDKILKLRIFEDEQGKINRSVTDVKGALLIVSQFTLWADLRRGNRPGFSQAAAPEEARQLYEQFCKSAQAKGLPVQTGVFGADMAVSLINDGPFTLCLDTSLWEKSA